MRRLASPGTKTRDKLTDGIVKAAMSGSTEVNFRSVTDQERVVASNILGDLRHKYRHLLDKRPQELLEVTNRCPTNEENTQCFV